MLEFLKGLPLDMLIVFAFIVVYGILYGIRNTFMRLYCVFTGREILQNGLGATMYMTWFIGICVFVVKEVL